ARSAMIRRSDESSTRTNRREAARPFAAKRRTEPWAGVLARFRRRHVSDSVLRHLLSLLAAVELGRPSRRARARIHGAQGRAGARLVPACQAVLCEPGPT